MGYKYITLDVFTNSPFGGNQLAVFPDATNIPEEYLQKIAKELNLSETTFVYPTDKSNCDHKVRIFTPGRELPMAGHPTLGTSHVLAKQRDLKDTSTLNLTLEEGVGPIPVKIEVNDGQPGLITMQQPSPQVSEPFEDRQAIADLLSLQLSDLVDELPVQVFDCGVPYMIIPIKSLLAIKSIKYRLDIYDRLYLEHQIPFSLAYTLETIEDGHDINSRMFAPEVGILEDPATGSAHGPLGCYLSTYNVFGSRDIKFTSEQGYELGRPSQLKVEIHQEGDSYHVLVGGYSVEVGTGELNI